MEEIRTAVEINASAERVWDFITAFEKYSDWCSFIRVVDGKAEKGATLSVDVYPPTRSKSRYHPKITVLEPRRRLRWKGHMLLPGLLDVEHVFEIAPLQEERVLLTNREIFKGILVPFMFGSMELDTREGLENMNADMKEMLEKKQVLMDELMGN